MRCAFLTGCAEFLELDLSLNKLLVFARIIVDILTIFAHQFN